MVRLQHSPAPQGIPAARVLDAALDLFVERGFAATRFRRRGHTRRRLQGHALPVLPSKEELLKAVIRQTVNRSNHRRRADHSPVRGRHRRSAGDGASTMVGADRRDACLRHHQADDLGGSKLPRHCASFYVDEVVTPQPHPRAGDTARHRSRRVSRRCQRRRSRARAHHRPLIFLVLKSIASARARRRFFARTQSRDQRRSSTWCFTADSPRAPVATPPHGAESTRAATPSRNRMRRA